MKYYFGIAIILLLSACQPTANKSKDVKDSTSEKTVNANVTDIHFKDSKVENIYVNYISLKDNLVNSNLVDAKSSAKLLAVALKGYAGCENTSLTANKIENATDIVAQRKEFTALSTDVIALFKHASLSKGTIYVQHCPMANKGDGGDWLSSQKKIQNPYYGKEMMECGAVIEEIKAK